MISFLAEETICRIMEMKLDIEGEFGDDCSLTSCQLISVCVEHSIEHSMNLFKFFMILICCVKPQ